MAKGVIYNGLMFSTQETTMNHAEMLETIHLLRVLFYRCGNKAGRSILDRAIGHVMNGWTR